MQDENVIKKQPNDKFPNIVQAILLIFVFLALSLLLASIVYFVTTPLNSDISDHPLFISIMSIIAVGIIAKFVSYKTGLKFTESLTFGKLNIPLTSTAFIALVGINILLFSIFWGISAITPFISDILSGFEPLYLEDAQISLWGVILNLLILEPIIEETFYRGIILRGLLKNYSLKKAIYISAFFYAVMHWNIYGIFTSFIAAIFLSYVYAKSKSLKSCIALHSLINLLPVTMLIFQIKTNLLQNDMVLNNNVPLLFIAVLYIAGLLLSVIGIKLFIKNLRSE